MRWATWAVYGFDHEMRIIWDDEMALAGKYLKKGFTINCFEAAQNNCVIPTLDAKHFPTENDSDREELAQGALQIESWTEGFGFGEVGQGRGSAGGPGRKGQGEGEDEDDGQGCQEGWRCRAGGFEDWGCACHWQSSCYSALQDPHTVALALAQPYTVALALVQPHKVALALVQPHTIALALVKPHPDPAPPTASSHISQEEKARLYTVYDRAQGEDREAQDELYLQRNGNESPIMYSALVPLKKGDEHHTREELTWFFEKDFAHWNALPKWVGCSFPDDK
ncbi:hypothetical protein K438DRAFT_1761190 [Mycena galopus ATCC 62051]|nr:hypothetical protein K438DRAFT_1761190 [Mycena galopus ATCC 62051]